MLGLQINSTYKQKNKQNVGKGQGAEHQPEAFVDTVGDSSRSVIRNDVFKEGPVVPISRFLNDLVGIIKY